MRGAFIDKSGEIRIIWRIFTMVTLLAAIVFATNVGWRAIGLPGQRTASELQLFFFALLITSAALLLITALLRLFEDRLLDAIWLPLNSAAMTQLLFGALLGSAPILLVVISALVAGYGSISPGNILINDLLNSMLPVLASVLLLSSLEEFTLRGYLFRQLAIVRQDPTLAAIVTGILFGLLHSGNPGANWQGLLFTSIGGILMGFLLIRSANLWLPIGYHFGWNACSGNVFGMSVSGMDVGPSILVTTLSGSNWLTGGSYGFESSIPAVAAEIMVLTSIILVFRRKGHETFSI